MADSNLFKKLGVKANHRMLLLNLPEGYQYALGEMPPGVSILTEPDGIFDCVQVFVHSRADVEKFAKTAVDALKSGGMLWFSYPKKSSKIKTDISRDEGWDGLKTLGLQGVSLISVDDTWSAMRFRPDSEIKPSKD